MEEEEEKKEVTKEKPEIMKNGVTRVISRENLILAPDPVLNYRPQSNSTGNHVSAPPANTTSNQVSKWSLPTKVR